MVFLPLMLEGERQRREWEDEDDARDDVAAHAARRAWIETERRLRERYEPGVPRPPQPPPPSKTYGRYAHWYYLWLPLFAALFVVAIVAMFIVGAVVDIVLALV